MAITIFNFRLKCLNVPTHSKLLSAVFKQQPGSANQYPKKAGDLTAAYWSIETVNVMITWSGVIRFLHTPTRTDQCTLKLERSFTHYHNQYYGLCQYVDLLNECWRFKAYITHNTACCKLIQISKDQWHGLTQTLWCSPRTVYCMVVKL